MPAYNLLNNLDCININNNFHIISNIIVPGVNIWLIFAYTEIYLQNALLIVWGKPEEEFALN